MEAIKGIATKTLFELGMFVLAFIIIAAFAVPGVQVAAENVLKWLRGEAGEYAVGDKLEDAIMCSYYRCTRGCDVAEGKSYSAAFSCSEFCSKVPSEFKEDGKICGWNAIQYPVELSEFYSEKAISKKIGDIDFDCFIPSNSSAWSLDPIKVAAGLTSVGSGALCIAAVTTFYVPIIGVPSVAACGFHLISIGVLGLQGKMDYNNIFIDASVLTYRDKVTCENTGFEPTKIDDAMSKFKISINGSLYIYSDYSLPLKYIGIDFGDKKMTTISSKPPYRILPQNEDRQMLLLKNKLNRIKVKDVGDIFVKPVVEWKEGSEGEDIIEPSGEVYSYFEVICQPGNTSEKGLTKDMCVYGGHSFCGGKLYVKCIDIDSPDKLWFSISWGGVTEGVYLYDAPNFGGTPIILGTDNDLRDNNFDNKTSSIYVPAKYISVTLYEKKNYEGQNMTLSGGYYPQGYHTNLGFNDKASSLKLIGPSGCWVELYDGEDYGGNPYRITSDKPNEPNLESISGPCRPWWCLWCHSTWADCASSIKVKDGCSVTLYENANYNENSVTANYITIAGNSSSLGFDNKASSIKIGA